MKNHNRTTAIVFAVAAIAALPQSNAQISISPSAPAAFTATAGNPSVPQTFTINSTGPSGAVVVSAPAGFEVSTGNSSFAQSVVLGSPGGSIQSVYRGGFARHTGTIWEKGSGLESPNRYTFAALTQNGSVVAWGSYSSGGNLSVVKFVPNGPNSWSLQETTSVAGRLESGVQAVFSNSEAFVALTANGSLVTWGNIGYGGNSSVSIPINGIDTEIAGKAGQLATGVKSVYSNPRAFAALTQGGSVVTWGDVGYGGNSSASRSFWSEGSRNVSEVSGVSISNKLQGGVAAVFSNGGAFAALKGDGSVVAWGDIENGGNSTLVAYGENGSITESSVAAALGSGVADISSTTYAFAARKSNGSVVAWGQDWAGGDVSSGTDSLASGVQKVFSNSYAFAALKENGSVVTWGDVRSGGNSSVALVDESGGNWSITEPSGRRAGLSANVSTVFANEMAFAALKNDGSVVAWGDLESGGNASVVVSNTVNGSKTLSESAPRGGSLASDIVAVYSNAMAFAALTGNGAVVTWGDAAHGGNASIAESVSNWESYETRNQTVAEIASVADKLSSNVTAVFSNAKAFAALTKNGSVVAWGDAGYGGNMTRLEIVFSGNESSTVETSVADQLQSGVIAVYSTYGAFTALKGDGSMVAWGRDYYGGSAAPGNIGSSSSGLPAQVSVRLASAASGGTVSGNLAFSTLGTEIQRLPLSGTIQASQSPSPNPRQSPTQPTPSFGGGGAPAGQSPNTQVQNSKKGNKGKSGSAAKSSGSKKKSEANKSSGKKKSDSKKSGSKKKPGKKK